MNIIQQIITVKRVCFLYNERRRAGKLNISQTARQLKVMFKKKGIEFYRTINRWSSIEFNWLRHKYKICRTN